MDSKRGELLVSDVVHEEGKNLVVMEQLQFGVLLIA